MTRRLVEPAALASGGLAAGVLGIALAYAKSPLLPVAVVVALIAVAFAFARPAGAVCLAVALTPMEVVSLKIGAAGLTPAEAMFVLAGWAWLARRLAEGQAPFSPSPLGKPLGLVLVAVIPGLAVATSTQPVVKVLVMWASFLLVYQLVVTEVDERGVRRILGWLAFSGAAVALVAIVKSGGHPQQLAQAGTVARGRATGTFNQPNLLATYLALCLPGALVLALRGPVAFRPAAFAAFAAGFVGLALSLSRGGAFAAFGALVLLIAWQPARRAALVAVAVVSVVVAIGANPLGSAHEVQNVVQRLSSVPTVVQSGSDPRFLLWRTAPTIIGDHPLFGVGANNFELVAEQYGLSDPSTNGVYDHAHDAPLTIGAELGLIGLAGFLWLVVAAAIVVVRALRRQWGEGRPLAFGVGAALLALGVEGVVDYTVRSNVIAATALLLLGCAVVLSGDGARSSLASAPARSA
jgi:putative inorganic carbon (HCO3(-)) transporter